jgi:hypothetical protein
MAGLRKRCLTALYSYWTLITRAKLSPCFGTAGSPFKGMMP